MAVHILGIRHHGPGCSRNVKAFLEALQPDIVLVEGPPEADSILQWAVHEELHPPVAILAYQPDLPQKSCFYPFAAFSPEWQAIQYAKTNNIHVRFMDLPVAHMFALENESREKSIHEEGENTWQNGDPAPPKKLNNESLLLEADETVVPDIRLDPISYLAEAAGYPDGEVWWEHMFEYRQDHTAVFEAITEAMQALRNTLPTKTDRMEQLREAHMRKTIRQAEKEMFQQIVVICGAWHAPALLNMPKQKEDNDLLKGLPKVKVECTWVPWTYNRLSYSSGYGAGISSPGWYEHNWHFPADDGTRWMSLVAKLFREQQKDTSVAHVMEAVRLANALAALRHLSKPGLEELSEATLSVLCNGEPILMSLIREQLIVSDRIGAVPQDIPKPPLQVDIEKLQKRLRLPATADFKDYTLDLRKENDLERSVFLHRLELLHIKWGQKSAVSGKGTFKEQWRLQWDPAFSVDIIEKGNWGNTVEEAAANFVIHTAQQANHLAMVCAMLENTIPAEIPRGIEVLINRVNNLAAASGDVMQLMEVIPSLVSISRYGNVRNTDATLVMGIVQSMVARIYVSLPAACVAIDEDAAATLLELFYKMNDAINVLQQDDLTTPWQQTLSVIAANNNTAPAIAGYATRLLADYKLLAGDALTKAFGYAMSAAAAPAVAAAWLEGFLKGSGTILLVDHDLWSVVDSWIAQLDESTFTQVLPLLRRTFSNYATAERRKLGEKVKSGGASGNNLLVNTTGIDEGRAQKGIRVVLQLLGYNK